MNVAYFLTKRVAFGQQKSFSSFIIKIAVTAIALSVAVMLITTATVNGFQNEISRKIFGFWGHIHINSFGTNRSYDDLRPVSIKQDFYPSIDTIEGISHIQVYAHKAGVMKTDDDIEGIVLKGIGTDFKWDFFEHYMVEGKHFELQDTITSNHILLSQTTANRLKLAVDDNIIIYFLKEGERPKPRKFSISGFYKTGLEEYDEKYALIDIKQIQKLNKWNTDEVGGFEVFIDDVNELDTFNDMIYMDMLGHDMRSQTIKEINPNIFEWLSLQDMNERVILTLMIVVAIINMITALLILILERTNMIGILKALGADNWTIRKMFLYNTALIIGLGLLFGNIIGISFCYLQQYFGFIQLPEEAYYISVAPVDINFGTILLLNLGTMFVCVVAMILPTYLVTRINPIKAIRFD